MIMLNHKTTLRHLLIILLFSFFFVFSNQSCFALNNQLALADSELDIFSKNSILFYDPLDCSSNGVGVITDSCFKIDSTVEAQDLWYPEGCLNTGVCTDPKYQYAASNRPPKTDRGLVATRNNPFLYDATQTDEDFGGMQYIYAENYNYEYNGAYTIMTPNGGNSTRKYYWIVLPDQAYSNGLGDTYIATFENLSEPVYFIVFDVHQCEHQVSQETGKGKWYCDEARADPDSVTIGSGFFGAFTKNSGSPTAAADIVGKLTSFCRINGTGEVLASENASNATRTYLAAANSSNNSSSGETTTSAQEMANKARELAWSENDSNNSLTAPVESFSSVASEVGTIPDSNDCLNFVQTVIKASRADSNLPTGEYPNPDEYKTAEYMNTSSKWKKAEVSSESDLEPGDVLISAVPPNSDGSHGIGKNHIFIYLGNGQVAAANQGKYYARVGNLASEWDPNSDNDTPFKYGNIDYQVFRLASDSCTSYEGDYPQYSQGAEPWKDIPYGGGTIGDNGCGAASIAMLLTVAVGQDITPADVAELTDDCAYNTGCAGGVGRVNNAKKLCEIYGCQAEQVVYSSKEDAYQKITQYLNDGWMLHFSGKGGFGPFTSPYGHYIGIFDWTQNGDNVMVADSGGRPNKEYSLRTLVDGLHNPITAIKGDGGSGKSCNNADICASRSNSDNTSAGEAASVALEERMQWLFPNGTPTSSDQMQQYLERAGIPIIDENGNKTTMNLTVHKKLVPEIKAIFEELSNLNSFRVKASSTGAYNWRAMASNSNSLSHHSYGVAIDLNWNDNPATYTGGTYSPGGNYYSVTDEVVQIWKKHGFYWGGDWSGYYKDYMHFTYTNH